MYKVYVINLKNDVEKKQHMEKLCQKFDLQTEFIDAVDGKKLTDKFVSEIYSSEMAINEIGRDLSRGEIGCALSHKMIYQKMIDENIETALILEDDIDFDESLLNILDLKEKFTGNWELILLGHHTGSSRKIDTRSGLWGKKEILYPYTLVKPCENAYGTYGYLISNKGAEKLLDLLSVITKPIDHYTGNSQYINLYTINPAPIKIHNNMSENYNSMSERLMLSNKHTASLNKENISLRKKIAQWLGIYEMLFFIKEKIRMLIKKIKPGRVYK